MLGKFGKLTLWSVGAANTSPPPPEAQFSGSATQLRRRAEHISDRRQVPRHKLGELMKNAASGIVAKMGLRHLRLASKHQIGAIASGGKSCKRPTQSIMSLHLNQIFLSLRWFPTTQKKDWPINFKMIGLYFFNWTERKGYIESTQGIGKICLRSFQMRSSKLEWFG